MSPPREFIYCLKGFAQKQISVVTRACIDTEKLNGNFIVIKYQDEANHSPAVSDRERLIKILQNHKTMEQGWVWGWFFFHIILILD